MLSYRHAFHAGNFADVIKHIVLVEILEHLHQKQTPFDYIDTHAGAGLFSLDSTHAQKLQEYRNGIAKLRPQDFPNLAGYFDVINHYNASGKLNRYPGSPSFAAHYLRAQDKAWLYELHPRDHQTLTNTMSKRRNIKVYCEDGLKNLERLLPPKSRRALVLIDPSYEIKTEYEQAVKTLIKAHKKFATGTYALWYPVINRRTVNEIERKLANSGIKNIQRFELAIKPDTNETGMTASGMIVINPPWKLFEKMSQLLPKLAEAIGEGSHKLFKCDVLAEE